MPTARRAVTRAFRHAAAPLLAGLALGACTALPPVERDAQGRPLPPAARQEPFVVRSPQGDRVDEYHWLRDDDPVRKRDDVMRYLRAEQAYTEAVLAPLAPLERTLVDEFRARIREDDSTAPQHERGWWYRHAFVPGGEYAVLVRRPGPAAGPDASAPEQVVLDGNALAAGRAYHRIGAAEVDPSNRLVAWTEDTVGRRGHELRFREIAAGRILPDRVPGTLEPVVWAADGRSVFYVRQDPVLLQSGPVCRHVLGTPASEDTVVHDEPDRTLFTSISRSASGEWLLVEIEGYDVTELRAVPLGRPQEPARVVLPRMPGVRNYADHLRGEWVIRTNLDARNFRLVRAGRGDPGDRTRWTDLLAHRPDASVDDFALMDGAIAVAERAEANARIRLLPWDGGPSRVVPVAEPAYSMTLAERNDAANPCVRVRLTSMVTPRTDIDVDLGTGAQSVRRTEPVLGYDRSRYATERAWAPSRDGRLVPVSVAWRRDAWAKDGRHPIRIEGYGAYGIPMDAEFDAAAVSLMDRGFALALVHVRGGADLGQDWYEDGRLLRKRNTFNDFVDATDFLGRALWCDPARRFATGGSAGGLLMGAVANMAGDRYRGIALHVPFVDVLTTMLDESIPLTTNEWSQWGNPAESREAYDYIRSYSPYDNLEAKPYPAMLVTTGLWDSQVMYFEPAKYVARLRRLRTDPNPLVFHVNMEAGHGGRSGRFERLREIAREQAFFIDLAGR